MVTQMHMKMVRPSGKPELLMMLEVIASLMPSPNMRMPITARQVSKTYYGISLAIQLSRRFVKETTIRTENEKVIATPRPHL